MSDFDDELPNDAGFYANRIRLNKFLAERGICSRRDADLWIESGRVTLNNEIVDVGSYVDDSDQVRVDGELISATKKPKKVYIALNKPIGIECTTDQRVDGNIVDFVSHQERVFPIGRLDKDSDGLILLTNDGEIVNKILRAEHNHEKEYLVTVDHKISAEFLRGMAQGVRILRRVTKPCKTYKVAAATFGIVLTEGMNRQIRKMAEAFGYRVLKLTRVRIMNISLGHIKLGRWRNLTPVELTELRKAISAPSADKGSTVIAKRSPRSDAVRAKPARTNSPEKAGLQNHSQTNKRAAASFVDKPKRTAQPNRARTEADRAAYFADKSRDSGTAFKSRDSGTAFKSRDSGTANMPRTGEKRFGDKRVSEKPFSDKRIGDKRIGDKAKAPKQAKTFGAKASSKKPRDSGTAGKPPMRERTLRKSDREKPRSLLDEWK